MKKEFRLYIFALLTLILALFIFSACRKNEPCTHVWTGANCTEPKTCSLCGKIESETLGHNYKTGKCSYCGEFDYIYCQNIYEEMRREMLDMTKDNTLTFIKEKLDSLPTDYKDVDEIKSEYLFISAQQQVISTAIVNRTIQILLPDSKKEYLIDFSKVRKAYFNLINSDLDYAKWDLTNLANDELFGTDDEGNTRNYIFFVIVGDWKTTSGDYFFDVIENDDNSISFRCNLPNNRELDKEYYYDVSGKNIDYVEIDSSENRITSYRITEISENFIKVFCYKNSKTYTFYRQ